jgi:hypothetical protein
MSRSGYSDDCDSWSLIRWRGAVTSAIKGERGQAFLCEALEALDAMPVKRLEKSVLVNGQGGCCTMGAVAIKRGVDVSEIDAYARKAVAGLFAIAPALAAEIAFENDEQGGGWWSGKAETPEERWVRMRAWVASQIKAAPAPAGVAGEPDPEVSP